MRKYRALRLHGFDPLTALALAALSLSLGQPPHTVSVLQFDFEVRP